MPYSVNRPMGNAHDRTRQNSYLLGESGPSAQAGQHTTNVNGSQTAGSQIGRQSQPQNYLAAAQDRQAGSTYRQQMAAANGSLGYQRGLLGGDAIVAGNGVASLSQQYRDQAKQQYAQTPGGAQMIQRAQQLSQSAAAPMAFQQNNAARIQGIVEQQTVDAQNQFLSDPGYQGSQDLLAANLTGNGTPGVNGLVTMQQQPQNGGRYALTGRANAAQGSRAESADPLTGGKIYVDKNGNPSSMNSPDAYAIDADTNPSYFKNAAQNAARIASRRAARGEGGLLTDSEQRRQDTLNRSVKRGIISQKEADSTIAGMNEYAGTRNDRNYLANGEARSGSQVAGSKRLPSGGFTAEAQGEAVDHINRLQQPTSPEDKAASDRIRGLGLDPVAMTATDVLGLMPQGQSNMNWTQMDPEKRSSAIRGKAIREKLMDMPTGELREYGRSLAQTITAQMALSESNQWEREGVSLWNDADQSAVPSLIASAADLDVSDDAAVDRWISSILHGNSEHNKKPKTTETPLSIGGFGLMTR